LVSKKMTIEIVDSFQFQGIIENVGE